MPNNMWLTDGFLSIESNAKKMFRMTQWIYKACGFGLGDGAGDWRVLLGANLIYFLGKHCCDTLYDGHSFTYTHESSRYQNAITVVI